MAAGHCQERRIILLGKVGAGKSAIGNAILGFEAFISRQSFNSVTQECCFEDCIRGNIRYFVCDTPGAKGLRDDGANFLLQLKRCLCVTSPGFHVIVFVISAGQRIEESDLEMFKEYETLLGDQAYDYSILVFTHVEPKNCKELILQSDEIKQLCYKCGNRYICFGNREEISSEYVNNFVKEAEDLVSKNNRFPYYRHTVYDEAFKIIMQDAKELREKNRNLSEEDAITEARKRAFKGKSPRDKNLIELMNDRQFRCCILL